MSRVITHAAIDIDLSKEALSTPPHIAIVFTEQDAEAKRETHGNTRFTDAEGATLLTAILNSKTTQGMLDAVNVAIDMQAAAIEEPGAVAARITAASDAERRARAAHAARAQAEAERKKHEEATAAALAERLEHEAAIERVRAKLAKHAADLAALQTSEPTP